MINFGFLYVAKRDRHFRPIIVINVERLLALGDKIPTEDIVDVADYFLDFVIKHLMHAGSVENFVMIVDLKDVDLTDLPLSKVKGIISSGQRNFRGRLFRQFTLNSGWVIRQAWKIVSSFVDGFTAQKMSVVKEKETLKNLEEHIDPECLEEKFGGKLPNISQGKFFPPDMSLPSGEQLIPSTIEVKEEVEVVAEFITENNNEPDEELTA